MEAAREEVVESIRRKIAIELAFCYGCRTRLAFACLSSAKIDDFTTVNVVVVVFELSECSIDIFAK